MAVKTLNEAAVVGRLCAELRKNSGAIHETIKYYFTHPTEISDEDVKDLIHSINELTKKATRLDKQLKMFTETGKLNG